MKSGCVFLLLALAASQLEVHGRVLEDDPTGTDKVDWWAAGQKELADSLKACFNVGQAKNVILFLGDGMGMSTVTAARWLQAQQNKKSVHSEVLSWERFPHAAISKTYNVDVKTADSAATATAFLAGYKARKGTVGVDQRVVRRDCSTMTDDTKLDTILHKSHKEGKWTGVVTTARATHATPAAAYASSPERTWEADSDIPEGTPCMDIAQQLVTENDFIRVFLAGGRRNFMPNNESDPEHPQKMGRRADGRNLMEEWLETKRKSVPESKVKLVMNDTDFKAVDEKDVEYLMGLFESSHMQYEADRQDPKYEKWGEPSLTEMTEKAINILKRSDKGFFLLVEGGRIDHGHHDGNAYRALTDTLAMAEAVQKADQLTDESDTLIVVTADHSHTFTLGGYPSINSDLFDLTDGVEGLEIEAKVADDGKPYTSLAYANGPGYTYHFTQNGSLDGPIVRRNLTEDSLTGKMRQKDYLQPAGVPLGIKPTESETHGGEDVPIYARGPMSHLFRGSHEQNYIAHVMMYASCVGDNKGHCKNENPFRGPCTDFTNAGTGQQAMLNLSQLGVVVGLVIMAMFSRIL